MEFPRALLAGPLPRDSTALISPLNRGVFQSPAGVESNFFFFGGGLRFLRALFSFLRRI